MSFRRRAERGAALLTALIVVVIVTLLVVGAVAITSSERNAAVQHTQLDKVNACKLAARNRMLSQIRVFNNNIRSIQFDEPIGDGMRIVSQHREVTADVHAVEPLRDVGGGFGDSDITNKIRAFENMGTIEATPYRVSVICTEANGRKHEVEFVVRVGI